MQPAGRVIGRNTRLISFSYATGAVTGTGSASYSGGLVGYRTASGGSSEPQ